MPAPKKPQDHKPKQATLKSGEFVGADGVTYTLPAPTEALKHMSTRDLRDALLGDESKEFALGFRILERCRPAPEVLDALYELPMDEGMRIIGGWLPSPDAEGTTLPQS